MFFFYVCSLLERVSMFLQPTLNLSQLWTQTPTWVFSSLWTWRWRQELGTQRWAEWQVCEQEGGVGGLGPSSAPHKDLLSSAAALHGGKTDKHPAGWRRSRSDLWWTHPETFTVLKNRSVNDTWSIYKVYKNNVKLKYRQK